MSAASFIFFLSCSFIIELVKVQITETTEVETNWVYKLALQDCLGHELGKSLSVVNSIPDHELGAIRIR